MLCCKSSPLFFLISPRSRRIITWHLHCYCIHILRVAVNGLSPSFRSKFLITPVPSLFERLPRYHRSPKLKLSIPRLFLSPSCDRRRFAETASLGSPRGNSSECEKFDKRLSSYVLRANRLIDAEFEFRRALEHGRKGPYKPNITFRLFREQT